MDKEVVKIALILSCNYYGQNMLYGSITSALDIAEYLKNEMNFVDDYIYTVFSIHMNYDNMIKKFREVAKLTQKIAYQGKIPAVVFYYNGYSFSSNNNITFTPFDFHDKKVIDIQLFNQVFTDNLHPSTELLFIYDAIYEKHFQPQIYNIFVKTKNISIINVHDKKDKGIIPVFIDSIKKKKINKIVSYKNVDIFNWLNVESKHFKHKNIIPEKSKLIKMLNNFF